MKVLRNRRQYELEIERHIIPDLGAFEKSLERLFLILSNWSVISLGLRMAFVAAGRGSSSPVLQVLLLSSVFPEW
jgi:hypothetical protein